MQQTEAKAQAAVEKKVLQLEEERLENQRYQEQSDELKGIEVEKKNAMRD